MRRTHDSTMRTYRISLKCGHLILSPVRLKKREWIGCARDKTTTQVFSSSLVIEVKRTYGGVASVGNRMRDKGGHFVSMSAESDA